jgi:hypothetical protein
VADCFFEDRRVRGDAAQPVFGDQLGEAAASAPMAGPASAWPCHRAARRGS